MRFRTDRRYELPLTPAELWAAVSRVEDYQSWWPWLRKFDGNQLAREAQWRCVVQPPLPYIVRFDVALDEVERETTVQATITGDVEGTARLDIRALGSGSEARLTSSLEPANALLKAVARLAAPLVRFGHDWVIDSGARQFIERADHADLGQA